MESTLSNNQRMFSNRALLALVVPLVLESILSLSAGIVDTIMVSSAGETATSGTSLAGPIHALLITLFSALAHGGVVLTTQYIGSGDMERARSSARQLLYSSTAVAIIFSLLCMAFLPQILTFLFPTVESAVFESTKTYLFWILVGVPFFAVGGACADLLRAQANTKIPLIMSIFINVLNIIGNAILIYKFNMGVLGAALSTTFARVVYAAIGLILCRREKLQVPLTKIFPIKLDFKIMRGILKIGGANGFENLLFYSGRIILSSIVATFPTIYIAANSVSESLCNFGWASLNTLGTALITVVGQCIGAGETDQAKYYTKKITRISTLFMVVVFAAIFLLRKQLVLLFGFGEDTLIKAADLTAVGVVVTIFSLYSHAFVPSSAFRAAGEISFPFVSSIASMFVFRIGLTLLLIKVTSIGFISIWIGMWADWVFRSVLNTIHFYRGKWLDKKAI